jgi:hypothetical protein
MVGKVKDKKEKSPLGIILIITEDIPKKPPHRQHPANSYSGPDGDYIVR